MSRTRASQRPAKGPETFDDPDSRPGRRRAALDAWDDLERRAWEDNAWREFTRFEATREA